MSVYGEAKIAMPKDFCAERLLLAAASITRTGETFIGCANHVSSRLYEEPLQ